MEFVLQRRTAKGYTPGELWCNVADYPASDCVCYTLELAKPIPAGTYKLALTVSGRAQRGELWCPAADRKDSKPEDFVLLQLLDVPDHDGIRMHAGNTVRDTKLCILCGFGQIADTLSQSRDALKAVMALYEAPCFLTIKEAV